MFCFSVNAKNLQDFLKAFLREIAPCVVGKLNSEVNIASTVEVLEPIDWATLAVYLEFKMCCNLSQDWTADISVIQILPYKRSYWVLNRIDV